MKHVKDRGTDQNAPDGARCVSAIKNNHKKVDNDKKDFTNKSLRPRDIKNPSGNQSLPDGKNMESAELLNDATKDNKIINKAGHFKKYQQPSDIHDVTTE